MVVSELVVGSGEQDILREILYVLILATDLMTKSKTKAVEGLGTI